MIVRLLGRPTLEVDGVERPGPRGRKTWALLAYLALADRPPSRQRLASLLFAEAEDPLAALRWTLSELRRFLGSGATITGDPVVLQLADVVDIDVRTVAGHGRDPAQLRRLTGRLLDGLTVDSHPAFAAWLDVERQRLAGAVSALLTEAAVSAFAHGRAQEAAELAALIVDVGPDDADGRDLLQHTLAGARADAAYRNETGSSAAARSYLDAGKASLSVGAIDAALPQLRRAVAAAESAGDQQLRAVALVALAGGQIHGAGARGPDVAALLHEGLALARAAGDEQAASSACRELAFLGVQLGQLERADAWLDEADAMDTDNAERASVLGVRGMRLSDGADYATALEVLARSVAHASSAGVSRQEAWSRSMVGRIHLLRGEIGDAVTELDASLETVRATRWTAFQPWVESFRAEAAIATGDLGVAEELLDHAWVLATETRDQCWLTTVARGQARLATVRGDEPRALKWVEAGLRPSPWYWWLRANLLDAGCDAAFTSHPAIAQRWAGTLGGVAARGGMREHVARAHFHQARLGVPHAIDAARHAALDVDNAALHDLLGTWAG